MAVFQKGAGAHGYRCLDGLEEREEVGNEVVRQLCPQEMLQDDLIGSIGEGDGPQVVVVHEAIKEVGTEDDSLGNLYRSVGELVELRMALEDGVEKSQATTLATQRALADAGKVGIAVELQTVEDSHHADVLHVAVLHDGIEDNLAVRVDVLQLVPGDVFQELTDGEDGACRKPAAHVVAANVAHQRVVRNGEDVVLQLLQRRDAHHLLLRHRVAEDEVAEAHVLLKEMAQVDVHLLRVLVDEMEAFGLCLFAVDHL